MVKKSLLNISPLLAIFIAVWVVILIPFRIIGYGFLPPDDAMRHATKVVSGQDWSRILVLRDEIKVDSYPGWHAILGFVRKLTGWDQHSLVLFSVIFLFILFCLTPVFFLRYPESWLLSLFALSLIAAPWPFRLLLGRPYIFTMIALLLIFFMRPMLKERKFQYVSIFMLTAIAALSIWIHASWYFFVLLVISFLLSQEWRPAALIAMSSVLGILIGASFTGHPIIYIKQMATHFFLVMAGHDTERQLVSELRPMLGDYFILSFVLIMLIWRGMRGLKYKNSLYNPVFILAALTFILGFVSRRPWLDWGIPALALWMAGEFEEFIETKAKAAMFSYWRVAAAALVAAVVYLSFTTDAGGRWSLTRPNDYISSEDPEQAEWLPSPGGIIYSDNMGVFYQTFYKNPKADWRYILGFESAFMPPEDLQVLRDIQKNFGRPEDFEPWVKKMRSEDRMIIRGGPDSRPKITGLEWHYIALNTWSGRKLRDK